jgi:Protein of unknown function (DUF992)
MSDSFFKKATLAALAGVAILSLDAPAMAQNRVKVGVLECSVSPGVGLIIGSSRSMDCVFRPTRGRLERYHGAINRIGLDIGFTGRGYLTWGVLAPTSGYAPGALIGDYAGVSAQASAGVGLGANALVGGSGRSIALQPISVEAQTGVNLAVGVAGLSLR